MHLARFPRVHLAHLPTSLEPLSNLTKFLGGPNLFIKRDDCTGLATGGNKSRKLEFLIADALEKGADSIVTHGAVQSNHVRQTAAAACRYDLKCEALLERRVAGYGDQYDSTGNVFLDRLFDAKLRYVDAGSDMDSSCLSLAQEIEARGGKPYVIPGGGSNSVGALGYVNAALELLQQANDQDLHIHCVVHGTGSTGTQAGLVVGLEGANSGIDVLGICVRRPKEPQEDAVYKLVSATADKLNIKGGVSRDRVIANGDYVGQGYGYPNEDTIEAIDLLAKREGILLDPVYSGKAMAGLIGLVREGAFKKTDNVLFIHTGGSMALFGYGTHWQGNTASTA